MLRIGRLAAHAGGWIVVSPGWLADFSDTESILDVFRDKIEMLQQAMVAIVETRGEERLAEIRRSLEELKAGVSQPRHFRVSSEAPPEPEAQPSVPLIQYSREEFARAWSGLPDQWWTRSLEDVPASAGSTPEEYFERLRCLSRSLERRMRDFGAAQRAVLVRLKHFDPGRVASAGITADGEKICTIEGSSLEGRDLSDLCGRGIGGWTFPGGASAARQLPVKPTPVSTARPGGECSIGGRFHREGHLPGHAVPKR
jgi:hypothetical protein